MHQDHAQGRHGSYIAMPQEIPVEEAKAAETVEPRQ